MKHPLSIINREKRRKAIRWGGTAIALLVAVLLAEPLLPPSEQETERGRVSVEERHAFVLEANGKPVLYIQNLQSDWADRPLSVSSDSTVCHTDTIEGCWTDRLYAIPSCRGRVTIPNMDCATDSIIGVANGQLRAIVARQKRIMEEREAKYTAMTDELNYYLEANNVTDEGYNTIATYATYVVAIRRRLQLAIAALSALQPTDSLQVRHIHHDTLLLPADSAGHAMDKKATAAAASATLRIACHDDGRHKAGSTYRRIQADNRRKPDGAYADFLSRPAAHYATYRVYKSHHALPPYVYSGEMAGGKREGHGVFIDRQGNYYNGEWLQGQRDGFGCAVDSTGKVSVGEWKAGRFLGQRLTYTEERIYGIDISRYQHDIGKKHYAIDWSQIRISHLGTISRKRVSGTVDYPVSFCFIKATEGITIQNKYYAADYAAARRRGIRTGAYHFFSTKSSAAEQASFFLSHARFSTGDMPPVLDVEPTDAQIRAMGGPAVLFSRIRTWMNAVEKRCGQRPILYVGQNFVNKYLVDAPDIKRDYQVWIARYGEYKPDVRLAFWQLCPDGRVTGIRGTVDINVFNGYRDQYEDFLDTYTIR